MSGDRRRRGGSAGYVLFGVLIGVAVLGVGMMAGVSLWSRVVQREREAELVFRGEAIVRALERYQQDRPGTLPQTLEELVERRYLRRAWLDPMTRSPFRLLRAETAAGAPGSPGSDTRAGMIPNPAAGEYEEEAARAGAGGRRRGGAGHRRRGEHQRRAQLPPLRQRPPLQRLAVRDLGGGRRHPPLRQAGTDPTPVAGTKGASPTPARVRGPGPPLEA